MIGATNPNELRILNKNFPELLVRIKDLPKGVITSDWTSDDSKFCIAGQDGLIRVYSVDL